MNNVCVWVKVDEDERYYSTQCGEEFIVECGTPEENKFKFCPYCGGELVINKEDA